MKLISLSVTFRSQSSSEVVPKRSKSSRARSIKTVDSVTEIRDIMTPASVASVADDESSVSEKGSLVTPEAVKERLKASAIKGKSAALKVGKSAKAKKGKKKRKLKKKSGSGKSTPMSLRAKPTSQPNEKAKSVASQQQQPQQQQRPTPSSTPPSTSTTTSASVILPSPSKRVEDVLPDLVPPRNGRQPSRRSTEAEKSAAIIEHVVEMDKHFCCFTCLNYFANFHQV